MNLDAIYYYFKKSFPELNVTVTPADDIVDAAIQFNQTPYNVSVYHGKCSVTVTCKKNGDVYFQHPLVDEEPHVVAEYLKKQLT